jgi:putative ABC transport system permease protein
VHTLLQDVRYALRTLAKAPGFTAVAVVTLALGIGANSAVFSVVNGVLLRPLPYPQSERLVLVWESNVVQGWDASDVAPGNFLAWAAESRAFERMAASRVEDFTLTGAGEPEQVRGAKVSGDFFAVLRAPAALGRPLVADDDVAGRPPVVVLAHGLWQRRWGGDPSVVGRTVTVDGEPRTVVGVMPAGFRFMGDRAELWVPAALALAYDPISIRGGRFLTVVARLAPGVSLAAAQRDLAAISARRDPLFGGWSEGWGARVVALHEQLVQGFRPALLLLLGAVGLVLAITCANVASLLLVRATAREREIAVRAALGASAARLSRQLLTESAVLALLGGALGGVLAVGIARATLAIAPAGLAASAHSFDVRVLAYTAAVALATGLAFGLAPVLAARRSHTALLGTALRATASRRVGRLRHVLVVGEIALAVVLVVGVGLLLRSFWSVTRVDPGFQPAHVLSARIAMPERRYDDPGVLAFTDAVLARLAALPGVTAVGATHALPLSGTNSVRPFVVAGRPLPPEGHEPTAGYRIVTPDYFRAMGIALVAGRPFGSADAGEAPPVVIVNQSFARSVWGDRSPMGARVTVGGRPDIWGEVVGVVRDVRHEALDGGAEPEMYWLYSQAWMDSTPTLLRWRRQMTLVVRGAGEPAALAGTVRRAVLELDPDQAVSGVRTMDELVESALAPRWFQLLMLAQLAALALTLATLGIYGAVATSVGERTRELGLRVALGAGPRAIRALVLGQGARLAIPGLAIGAAGALASTRLLARFLYGVRGEDPWTYAAVAALLVVVTLLACWLPARRATQVDPMITLRQE